MIGKPFGDERAEHPLDRDVDLGDEIDRALLVDAEARRRTRHLDVAGASDGLDGGGEKERIGRDRRRSPAAVRHWPARRDGRRLIMRISMPPSGARCSCDVVHEVADEEDAAAAGLEQVLRRQRIGDLVRVEAFALVADADGQRRDGGRSRSRIRRTRACGVVAVAVLDGVDHRFADRRRRPSAARPRRGRRARSNGRSRPGSKSSMSKHAEDREADEAARTRHASLATKVRQPDALVQVQHARMVRSVHARGRPVRADKVYLVGFMTAGKTTVARALGRRLSGRRSIWTRKSSAPSTGPWPTSSPRTANPTSAGWSGPRWSVSFRGGTWSSPPAAAPSSTPSTAPSSRPTAVRSGSNFVQRDCEPSPVRWPATAGRQPVPDGGALPGPPRRLPTRARPYRRDRQPVEAVGRRAPRSPRILNQAAHAIPGAHATSTATSTPSTPCWPRPARSTRTCCSVTSSATVPARTKSSTRVRSSPRRR